MGGHFFQLGWHPTIWQILLDRSPLFLLLLSVVFVFVLAYTRRLPPIWDIKLLLSVLNDKGGQILILVTLSIFFFGTAMKLFYFGISGIMDKTLAPDNAVFLMAAQFVTGVAFGGSFGAFLKTLDGGSMPQQRAIDTDTAIKKIATETASTIRSTTDKIPPTEGTKT